MACLWSGKKYKRVLLKISGEALSDSLSQGSQNAPQDCQRSTINPAMLNLVVDNIISVWDQGIEVAIVIGGGNIWRGAQFGDDLTFERSRSDTMGMLATMINGLALLTALEQRKVGCKLLSAINSPTIAETFVRDKAVHYLSKRDVVICAGGTGNPFFTTDTAAALRACELDCNLLLKATKTKGVYSKDPHKNPDAEFLPALSYREVIDKNLQVMDMTAITLASANKIPVAVFSIYENNGFSNVLNHKTDFTLIS